jgi:hypothetical protein
LLLPSLSGPCLTLSAQLLTLLRLESVVQSSASAYLLKTPPIAVCNCPIEQIDRWNLGEDF